MAKNNFEAHECDWCWFPCADLLNQLIVLLAGVVLLLVNMGLLDSEIIAYWPIVLILMALRALLRHR